MTKTVPTLIATTTVAALAFGLSATADARHYRRTPLYEVVITNITRGQILSPPVVFTHRPSYKLFEVGAPASPELAAIAEDAQSGGLEAQLAGDRRVTDRQTGGAPIPPGQSMALEVRGGRWASKLTAVGMLVVTNDAFFAANGVDLPRWGSVTYRAVAYDAGSEANTESCAHIPGPPCGNGGVRVTAGAEGFVHVHGGVHGGSSLDPAQHDWRNPTVQITITRIR